MNSTGIMLVLAYPETVVRVSDEWFSPLLPYVGIGKKDFVRAGHAALVLIDKSSGVLEYHDFGRYITSLGTGRVRGKETDNELDIPLKAVIRDEKIENLEEILEFLATNPKIIHGEGKLVASVCDSIDYQKARDYISMMQEQQFIRYGVFIKSATNCSRFVTTSLIASVTDPGIRRRLIRSTWFTPSTVGNVVIANTADRVYEVSQSGKVSRFRSSARRENIRCFLDRLKDHHGSLQGNLNPKPVDGINGNAQWLGGIGAGAWFELHETDVLNEYEYRKISAYGDVDVHDLFLVDDGSFSYHHPYTFVHYSNCQFFHIEQYDRIYKFIRKSNVINSVQSLHSA